MIIEEATAPTEYDKRFRCLFERMPFGHESIALARWTGSNGTIRYLGNGTLIQRIILTLLVWIDRNGTAYQRSVGTSGQ